MKQIRSLVYVLVIFAMLCAIMPVVTSVYAEPGKPKATKAAVTKVSNDVGAVLNPGGSNGTTDNSKNTANPDGGLKNDTDVRLDGNNGGCADDNRGQAQKCDDPAPLDDPKPTATAKPKATDMPKPTATSMPKATVTAQATATAVATQTFYKNPNYWAETAKGCSSAYMTGTYTSTISAGGITTVTITQYVYVPLE